MAILRSVLHATKASCKSQAALLPGAQASLPLAVRTCWITAVLSLGLKSQAGIWGKSVTKQKQVAVQAVLLLGGGAQVCDFLLADFPHKRLAGLIMK